MKAIRYILLSYFQQSPILLFVMAAISFTMASIWTLTLPHLTMNSDVGIKWNGPPMTSNHWVLFLVALVLLVASMGSHLTRLIKSNASTLVPYYRQKQLIAAGIVLAVFIVWPTIVTGYKGFPVLSSVAMFLFATSLVLWSSFNFPQNIFTLTIIIWLLRLAYELLGLPTDIRILASVSDFAFFSSSYIFPVSLIILSCISLTYFVHHFLNLSILQFSKEESDNSAPESTINHDRVGPIAAKFVTRNLTRVLAHKREQMSSMIHTVRLIQFSFFTPTYTVFFLSSVIYLGMLLYLATVTYFTSGEFHANFLFAILFMSYPFYSVTMTTDFLQHRNRMPAIWLQTECASRKEFTTATIYMYLFVMGKQYISISLINFFLLLIFPAHSLTILLPIMAMGFIVFVGMLSLSLIVSHKVRSPDCKGWLITCTAFWGLTFMVLVGLISSETSPAVFGSQQFIIWLFIGSISIFTGILFRIGIRKWENTEMDFVGPEVSTSW